MSGSRHDCRSHAADLDKRHDLRKIDRFNIGLFASMVKRLRSVPEP